MRAGWIRARRRRASRRPRPAFPCQGLVPRSQTWNCGPDRPWLRLTTRPSRTIARCCKNCPTCCRDNVTLASLTPDGGLFRQGPDLASLGYDNVTAVYDISAHAVYLPNGLSLEAHSGMGSLKDDPEHVSVPDGRRDAAGRL